jgi:HEAT repeat protein
LQRFLLIAALAFAAGDIVFVVLLLGRRMRLQREEDRRLASEERLRPLALAITDGDAELPGTLRRGDGPMLASLLSRYAQWLSGTSREALADWFELHGEVGRGMRGLRDRRAFRRAAAAHSLGDMGSTAAVGALIGALSDPVRDVRAAAARSLGRIASPIAVPELVRALTARQVPAAVGAQALLAIGAEAVPALRRLTGDDDPVLVANAVELVALIGDAGDARWLHELLAHPHPAVRASAAFALGRLGDEDDALALVEALRDPDSPVRVACADALREIGDVQAVPALLDAARGADFESARAAARAVGQIAPQQLREAAHRYPDEPHLHEANGQLALGTA